MKYLVPAMALATICSMCVFSSETANAEHRFELTAPHLGVASQAVLSKNSLQVIDSRGNVTDYRRDTRYDSHDGTWLGFYSHRANQILRWPSKNTGRMQIGTIRGRVVDYSYSQMTIRSLAARSRRVVERPVLPPIASPRRPGAGGNFAAGNLVAGLTASKLFHTINGHSRLGKAEMLRIASFDATGSPWVLTRGTGFDLACVSSGSTVGADWWVAPAGVGYVRMETYDRGRVLAVSSQPGGRLALLPVGQDPHQLWHVAGAGRVANQFLLENVAYPGSCLARLGNGHVALQPIHFSPTQLWMSYSAPLVPTFQPFVRSTNTGVVPNAQLPPAQLELANTHRYALIVLLGDVRQGNSFEQIRIESGSSAIVTLDRDSGATIVETIELRSPVGIWERQQYVTAIPPRSFYDLSVYEEHLQSIAIDATGKSPNPIEDVNYVPKRVGWIPLPAGPGLPASGHMDVYRRAQSANNPGAVRRIDLKAFLDEPIPDPLEKILNKFRSLPRRKF